MSETPEGSRAQRVLWNVEISAAEWDDVIRLNVGDISRNGLFVASAQSIAVGTPIELTIVLPDETVLEVTGVVAQVVAEASQSPDEPQGFSVAFDEQSRVDLALLEPTAASFACGRNAYRVSNDSLRLPALITLEGAEVERTSVQRAQGTEEGAKDPTDGTTGNQFVRELPQEEGWEQPLELEPTSFSAQPVRETTSSAAPAVPPPSSESITTEKEAPPPLPPLVEGHPQTTVDALPLAPPPPPEKSPPKRRPDIVSAVPSRDASPPPPPADTGAHAPSTPKSDGFIEPVAHGAKSTEPIFGIDLGTSYTSIALVDGERARLLEDEDGNTMMPSAVCFPENGNPVVGWPAREKMLTNPSTTFISPKRLLGRRYDDRNVEPFIGASPVHFEEGPNGQVVARMYGDLISIPQVCSHILRRAAEIGNRATGIPVRRVLLSAPVGYQEIERVAIRRAAEFAGLEVVSILDEPIAASMAYGLGREGNELVAVYDFGGGTFDFTVLEIKDKKIQVIGEAGDPWLGGDDFDDALANEAANIFWRRHNVDLRKRQVEWQRLLFHCETAKRQLSTQRQAEILAKGIVLSLRGPIDLKMNLDRELFGQLCGELVDQSLSVVDSCLSLIELKPTDIDHVVMTGGVSRIPLVRQRVEEYFQRETRLAVNPEHAIVLGNAIFARFLQLTGRAPVS